MFEELLRSLGIGGEVGATAARILAPDPAAGMLGMTPKSSEADANAPWWKRMMGGMSGHMMPMLMQQMQPRGGQGGAPAAPPPMPQQPFQYNPGQGVGIAVPGSNTYRPLGS